MVTWQQLGFHSKPIGVLNIEGYYDQLLSFFEHGITEVGVVFTGSVCANSFAMSWCSLAAHACRL